jgi:Sap, sulfolipid-1-addressing protein
VSQLVAQLASAAVIGALSPVATMAAIAVLAGRRNPLVNALVLLGGWSLSLVVLAGLLRLLLSGNGDAVGTSAKAVLNLIIGLVLVSLGLRILLGARHPLEATASGETPPSPAVPGWLRQLDNLSVVKAFGVGAVLLAISPADLATYLSAEQGLAGKSATFSVVVTILLILAIDLCILIPIGIYVAMPGRAVHILDRARWWLIANQRTLTAWVSVGFGVLLIAVAIGHLA